VKEYTDEEVSNKRKNENKSNKSTSKNSAKSLHSSFNNTDKRRETQSGDSAMLKLHSKLLIFPEI
jgi:hypothetical protein